MKEERTMIDPAEYWEAVQARVCTHCVDSDRKGNCRLEPGRQCALKTHFGAALDAVLSTHSEKLAPYVDSLRKNVCGVCDYHGRDGVCAVRNEIACGLDRYFPLVVEAIEDMNPVGDLTNLAAVGVR